MENIRHFFKKLTDKLTDKKQVCRICPMGLLICYIILLLWIIVFKCNVNNELHIDKNLAMPLWERFTYRIIPFQDAVISFATHNTISILAFFFNTICCIPGGVLLAFFLNKKQGILWSSLFILGVEMFQLFSGWGGFDLTDVLMNVLGIYLGYLIFDLLYPKLKPGLVNMLSLYLFIFCIPLVVFVIIRTVLHFPV